MILLREINTIAAAAAAAAAAAIDITLYWCNVLTR